MSRLIVLSGLFVVALVGLRLHAAEPDPKLVKQVQEDARLLYEIVFRLPKNAVETERWLKIMHPIFIEETGGEKLKREKMTKGADSPELKKLESLFKIESVEFPEPPRFIDGREHEFVIVPLRMTILRGNRFLDANDTFYLGGRKRGDKDFVYVDLVRFNSYGPKKYFPDFPEGVELPTTGQRRILPKK